MGQSPREPEAASFLYKPTNRIQKKPLAKNLTGSFSLSSAQLQRDKLESPGPVWQGRQGVRGRRERRGETRAGRRPLWV